jgi:hypothetical protein
MELFGFVIGDFYIQSLIQFLITFFIGAVLLHLATGILGFEKRGIGTAAGTVLVGSVFAFFLSFIPFIGWFLGLIGFWYIIKKFYDVGWIKAVFAWLMSIVVAFIIAIVVLFILGISFILIPSFF